MDSFKGILDGVINKFVCEDGGLYRGQCPQLPKYAVRACGGNWPGATGHGYQTVDRVVQIGGYYGESSRGYRICSCDVAGSPYGHTWVEINVNGNWVIYEQNAGRAGVPTADYGVGTVYAVTTTNNRGSWRLNVRYAGHPAIDAYIDAHKPAPAPAPAKKTNEELADEVIKGLWGNNPERKQRLEAAGYDYNAIQAIVNERMAGGGSSTGFKVGDVVVPTRLVDYNGTPLVQYDPTYTISQINGDRAVLTARGAVWAAMRTSDIRKA